jgi:YD repeat-containing protein
MLQYDALNNPTIVTDSKAQVYATDRNISGWPIRQTDPTGHLDSLGYDLTGNVVYTRSRQGRVVAMEYDALGRVTKRIGVAEKDTITYGYDPAGRWISARAVSRQLLVSTDTVFVDSIARPQFENTYRPGVGPWSVASTYQGARAIQVGPSETPASLGQNLVQEQDRCLARSHSPWMDTLQIAPTCPSS